MFVENFFQNSSKIKKKIITLLSRQICSEIDKMGQNWKVEKFFSLSIIIERSSFNDMAISIFLLAMLLTPSNILDDSCFLHVW